MFTIFNGVRKSCSSLNTIRKSINLISNFKHLSDNNNCQCGELCERYHENILFFFPLDLSRTEILIDLFVRDVRDGKINQNCPLADAMGSFFYDNHF